MVSAGSSSSLSLLFFFFFFFFFSTSSWALFFFFLSFSSSAAGDSVLVASASIRRMSNCSDAADLPVRAAGAGRSSAARGPFFLAVSPPAAGITAVSSSSKLSVINTTNINGKLLKRQCHEIVDLLT
jgi:hypothetical protein